MQEISSCNILISCVPQINPKELILISIPITALVRTPRVTYTHSVDFICGVSKVNRNYLHSGLLVFTNAILKNAEGNINDEQMFDSYKKNLRILNPLTLYWGSVHRKDDLLNRNSSRRSFGGFCIFTHD